MKKRALFTIMASLVALGTTSCNNNKKDPSYYITWLDYDEIVLRVDTVTRGKIPSYGSKPTRDSDGFYTYEFSGWSPEVVPATANAKYKATYESTPITEIDEETFNKAKNFYDKNFTLVINSAAGYEETLTHNEKNECYSVYKTDTTSYHALFNEHDDVMNYFTGETSGEKIIWNNQLSGTVSELYQYAFDQNKYIQKIMGISFDDLTYDSEDKCYKLSIDSENWTLNFAGERLLSATSSIYNVVTTFTFSDYDETEVKYDQYLTDYITNMYPTKETLQSIIEAALLNKYPDSLEDGNADLEFYLTYYENGENMEYYEVHMEQILWHFLYDGKNEIYGEKSGGYVFIPFLYEDYILESGKRYVYNEDDYNLSPFDEGTVGTRSHKAIELAEYAVEYPNFWKNYSVTCGKVEFDIDNYHYTFEIRFNNSYDDLAWYIEHFNIRYNDGEKDIEYNMEYINIEFDFYDGDDIELVGPEE